MRVWLWVLVIGGLIVAGAGLVTADVDPTVMVAGLLASATGVTAQGLIWLVASFATARRLTRASSSKCSTSNYSEGSV